MSAKKKIKKKLSVTKVALMVLALVLIALAINYAVQQWHDRQLLSEQKVRLDAAYEDISLISNRLLGDLTPSEKIVTRELKKECGESSTKYGRGTINCRATFYVRLLTDRGTGEFTRYENELKKLISETKAITDSGSPRTGESYLYGNRYFSITSGYMGSAKTDCYFDINAYNAEQYKHAFMSNLVSGNAIDISLSCHETTKEPIYPLVN